MALINSGSHACNCGIDSSAKACFTCLPPTYISSSTACNNTQYCNLQQTSSHIAPSSTFAFPNTLSHPHLHSPHSHLHSHRHSYLRLYYPLLLHISFPKSPFNRIEHGSVLHGWGVAAVILSCHTALQHQLYLDAAASRIRHSRFPTSQKKQH